MSEKLEPCPFCGGEAEVRTGSTVPPDWFYVGCDGCRCNGAIFRDRSEAIRLWNTRKQKEPT